jgi:hypothetical protein
VSLNGNQLDPPDMPKHCASILYQVAQPDPVQVQPPELSVPTHNTSVGWCPAVSLELLFDIVEINARRAEGVVRPAASSFQ